MYAIKRSDGLYLADGAVYTNKNLPRPIWQGIEGSRQLYLEKSLCNITLRRKDWKKYTRNINFL